MPRKSKQTRLSPLDYLGTIQHLVDEGFSLSPSSDIRTRTVGVRVKETGVRFFLPLSHMKARCIAKRKFDTGLYRGRARQLAESWNRIIDKYVPPAASQNVVTRIVPHNLEFER